jgi:probable F420-dependent oxidoreductase
MDVPRRPFRFGLVLEIQRDSSASELVDVARRAADAGCSIVLGTDHFRRPGVLPLLQAIAERTELRIGMLVLNNDMRHPAVLAQDFAAIDDATGGRLEIGLGAGWDRAEYAAIGVPFDAAGARVSRLEASVRMIKGALRDGHLRHPGDDAYPPIDMDGMPVSVQRPHPPVLIGGGSKRVLSIAGREADIVGLDTRSLPDGTHDGTDVTAAATERKIGWIREGAGERFGELEINTLVFGMVPEYPARPGALAANAAPGVSEEEIADGPHYLYGDVERMADHLLRNRERWGVSYLGIRPAWLESLRPLIARLAGR